MHWGHWIAVDWGSGRLLSRRREGNPERAKASWMFGRFLDGWTLWTVCTMPLRTNLDSLWTRSVLRRAAAHGFDVQYHVRKFLYSMSDIGYQWLLLLLFSRSVTLCYCSWASLLPSFCVTFSIPPALHSRFAISTRWPWGSTLAAAVSVCRCWSCLGSLESLISCWSSSLQHSYRGQLVQHDHFHTFTTSSHHTSTSR